MVVLYVVMSVVVVVVVVVVQIRSSRSKRSERDAATSRIRVVAIWLLAWQTAYGKYSVHIKSRDDTLARAVT